MTDTNINKFDIGKLSEPITALINRIADGAGILYEPTRLRRLSKAKIEAEKQTVIAKLEIDKLKTIGKIELKEIQKRAMIRFVNEETKKQINIENILESSFEEIKEDAKPENISDEWLLNFFDKCKYVSDEQMQMLWGKVLAGESNKKGKYSKQAINLLATLEKEDIEIFEKLIHFRWHIGNRETVLIYDIQHPIYTCNQITFSNLLNLQQLGLIGVNYSPQYTYTEMPKRFLVGYEGPLCVVECEKEFDNIFPVGFVVLTKLGYELAPLCKFNLIPNLQEHIFNLWINNYNVRIYSLYITPNNYTTDELNQMFTEFKNCSIYSPQKKE